MTDKDSRNADVVGADVIIASVASLARTGSKRIYKYDPSKFKCVIIDEVHTYIDFI